MKNNGNFIGICIVVLIVLTLTCSCTKERWDNKKSDIVGTWKVTSATINGVEKNIKDTWTFLEIPDANGLCDIQFDFNGYFGDLYTDAYIYHNEENNGTYFMKSVECSLFSPHSTTHWNWTLDMYAVIYSYHPYSVKYHLYITHFSKHKIKCKGSVSYKDSGPYFNKGFGVNVQLTLTK